jgi:hypothetical protein
VPAAFPPFIVEPIWEQSTAPCPEERWSARRALTAHASPPSEWSSVSWFRSWCVRLRLPRDRRRRVLFGDHASGSARRADSLRGDRGAAANSARSLRPLRRPGAGRRGRVDGAAASRRRPLAARCTEREGLVIDSWYSVLGRGHHREELMREGWMRYLWERADLPADDHEPIRAAS